MRKLIKYIVSFLIGGAVFLLVLFFRYDATGETAAEWMLILSDSLCAAGLLLLLSGLLLWLVGIGTFSGMGYAFSRITVSFHKKAYREEHRETFSEYKERKGKKKKPVLFLLVTGTVYLVPGIICTILFYVV